MTRRMLTITGVFAGIALLPFSAIARTPKSVSPEPAAFEALRADAAYVRTAASEILTYRAEDWESHAARLESIKEKVNDMARKYTRLASASESLSDLERDELNRIQPAMLEMAYATSQALRLLNENQSRLMLCQSYSREITYLHDRAAFLATTAQEFANYAKAATEKQNLENTLGLRNGS
jgi:hypothetical protein